MSCTLGKDLNFGPVVNPCRRPFDFTLVFEETILTLLPSALGCAWVLVATFTLARTEGNAAVGSKRWLQLAELTGAASITLLQVTVAAVTTFNVPAGIKTNTPLTFLTGLVSSALALLLLILTLLHAKRCYRPSTIIVTCHGVLVLAEAIRSRTYFLLGHQTIGFLLIGSIIMRIMVLVLESLRRPTGHIPGGKEMSPEERAGIINRLFFQWLVPLLTLGHRRHLTCDDLRPVDRVMYSASLEVKLAPLFVPQQNRSVKSTKSLARETFLCMRRDLASAVVPRLALIAFKVAQLFIVRYLLEYLQHGVSSPTSNGYGLIGACAFTYTGIAVVTGWYYHRGYRCASIAQGGLVLAIFSKMLRLREDAGTESRAITLMVSDVQRISVALVSIHEIWAAPIEVAIFMYLLQNTMGPTSLCVLGLAATCMAVTSTISRSMAEQQGAWLLAVQTRLQATQKMLSDLKAIKMMGMEKRMSDLVSTLRVNEMAAARPFRSLLAASSIISYTTLSISPLLVFGAYLGTNGLDSTVVDATRMFTSLVLVALLTSPLVHLFQVLPGLGAAYGCLNRLQDFLALYELPVHPNPVHRFETENKRDPLVNDEDDVLISLKGVSLAYAVDEQTVLRQVDLEVKRGKRVAILGAVGTGKSLLLKFLLGEAHSLNDGGGTEIRTDSFAYCSQKPWLENISAEANWTRYARSQDTSWMTRITHACALDDIISLEDYASGTVGSGGSRLSGGQRQRLALARALALKKDVLLLDDVFSALDPGTKSKIVQRVLGPNGLARSREMTVIFTTHDRDLVSVADEAYEIDHHGHFVSVVTTTSPESPETPQETRETTSVFHQDHYLPMLETGSLEGIEKEVPRMSLSSISTAKTGKCGSQITPSKTPSDGEVYLTYARAMGLQNASMFLIAGITFSATLKLPDLWVKWWTDALQLASKVQRPNTFWLGIYGLLTTTPLFILGAWLLHLMLIVVPTSGIALHNQLLHTVLHASFPHISRIDTGHLINRFNQDLIFIDTQLPLALFSTSSCLFTSMVQITLVAMASLPSLAVVPPLLGVLYVIQRFYLRTSKQLRLLELETKGDLHTQFAETAAGITTIRAHKWTAQSQQRFAQTLDRSQEPCYLLYSIQRWLQLVLDLVVAGLVLVVAGVAVGLNKSQQQPGNIGGAVTVGAIGVALTNATSLGETLTALMVSWTSLETTLGAVARILLFQRNTRLEEGTEDPGAATIWPQRGSIELTNVWASYATTPHNSHPNKPLNPYPCEINKAHHRWTLRGITASFPPGSKVSICGPTGSGKSTLLLALLGMIDISAGSVIIDGVPIFHVSHSALRQRFDVISQDYFTCATTLRDELDPDGEFSDAQLRDALRECLLWDKLAGEFEILNTPRDNLNLSSGETQLLCWARVLLRSSKEAEGILLLDEATSSVDGETDAIIHRLMLGKLGRKTILSVSHRPETAMRFDEIVVMEGGAIVDRGKAKDVVGRCKLFLGVKG
ncbi:P-loop containing nucleoside triphosphate hydrolase protein [Cercophora newfieldiana]|uniref:P-loop containing nucleoside triphosphate hydrolase protein n=1 Tax=Cercophora newfieldiana TaxID=92897 RepID=A0AA39YE65_9PEZI|nr:P-loop containing nucleoside triphosphate hydrolase protein [Cercophora newfieldiana]